MTGTDTSTVRLTDSAAAPHRAISTLATTALAASAVAALLVGTGCAYGPVAHNQAPNGHTATNMPSHGNVPARPRW